MCVLRSRLCVCARACSFTQMPCFYAHAEPGPTRQQQTLFLKTVYELALIYGNLLRMHLVVFEPRIRVRVQVACGRM